MTIEKNQAYNYAILNADIAEEAALMSSSEGYDAELDVSVNSFTSQLADIETVAADEIAVLVGGTDVDYMSTFENTNDNNELQSSVISDVSDSILLLQERETHATLKWYRRPSVIMISLMLFLYTFSAGISMSSELQMVLQGVCYSYNHGELTDCSSNGVQQANANIQKWTNFISSIIKILVSTKIGKMSDIYGRKPVILVTFIMTALSKFLLIFVLQPQYFSFNSFLASNLVDSLGGCVYVMLGSANSYTIDVVHEKNRLQAMGQITGALFLGLSLGPLFSSFLSASFSIEPTYLIGLSATMMFLSILLVILVIPESRGLKLKNKSRRLSVRSQREQESNPTFFYKLGLSSFFESFTSLKLLWVSRPIDFKNSLMRSDSEVSTETSHLLSNSNNLRIPITSTKLDMTARFNVILLLGVEILITFCISGASLPVALYLVYTFQINQNQLGLFVGVAAGLRAIVLTLFNPWMQHHLLEIFNHDSFNIDFIDVTSIGFAILCELIAALLASSSTTLTAVFLYVIFSSATGIASPVIHAALLKYNPSPGKNGEFFGALALIRNLINLISPWVFLSIYSFGLGIGKPQLIFYLIFIAFSLSALLMGNLKFHPPPS
ncbi:hypothetical protein C6P40_003297 [Pichia californica]|uniref:Major facilitator superfamily (MFS) profile domain-containing protein n=1 Tax=Pichia californica TaxID=460514 RepID=A0A9P6WGQ9_9ASCO|nr:hypothetical protein C6P42_003122 [[Candida] californica]KAG0686830.1 hypothetical protein C6P40_003297 [[Candida] californica]